MKFSDEARLVLEKMEKVVSDIWKPFTQERQEEWTKLSEELKSHCEGKESYKH